MAARLTVAQMEARYEALAEAAQHLQMDWTDKPIEAEQGLVMAEWLREQSLKWLEKARVARERN